MHYVGVGKETARGRDAIERLFRKYEASGRGITSLNFDIRHTAENGKIRFWQEHYDVARFEQMYAKGIYARDLTSPGALRGR